MTMRDVPRRWLAIALLGAAFACTPRDTEPPSPGAAGPAGPSLARDEVLAIPEPDLTGAAEGVREQIETARAKVAAIDADPARAAVDRAQAYGELGLLYMIYDFLEAAEAALENARRIAPGEFQWAYLRGYLHQLLGEFDLARERFEQALKLEPDFPPALLRLGRVQLDRGEVESARALFERALELDSSLVAGHEGLGKVANVAGDARAAIGHFERALELEPRADSLHYSLGQAYRNLGDLDKARFHLERRGDNLVLIPDPFLQPLANIGQSAEFYLMRGAEALEDDDFEIAAVSYQRAVELDAGSFPAYRGLAYAAEQLGNVKGAVAHLETALEAGATGETARDERERAEIHRILGGLLAKDGRDADAVTHYQASLQLDPDQPDPRMRLANALARQRRFAEALAHYDAMLEDYPDQAANLHVRRATTLVNLEHHDAAIDAFEQAVASAPGDPQVRLLYAEALERLGRSTAAAEQFAAASRLADDGGERARLLAEDGRRLVGQGRYEEAVAQLREALELEPERPAVRYELASVLGHLGRYDAALSEFRRVIEADERHAEARRGEIVILLLTERHGEARIRLQEALRIFQQDALLAHVQARLLASTPDLEVRDGLLALEIAKRLFNVRKDFRVRETLAMALAEAGDVEQAAEIQARVVEEVRRRGDLDLLRDVESKLEAFRRGQPWFAASGEEIVAAVLGGQAG